MCQELDMGYRCSRESEAGSIRPCSWTLQRLISPGRFALRRRGAVTISEELTDGKGKMETSALERLAIWSRAEGSQDSGGVQTPLLKHFSSLREGASSASSLLTPGEENWRDTLQKRASCASCLPCTPHWALLITQPPTTLLTFRSVPFRRLLPSLVICPLVLPPLPTSLSAPTAEPTSLLHPPPASQILCARIAQGCLKLMQCRPSEPRWTGGSSAVSLLSSAPSGPFPPLRVAQPSPPPRLPRFTRHQPQAVLRPPARGSVCS